MTQQEEYMRVINIKSDYCGYNGFDCNVKYVAYSSRLDEDCYGREFCELLIKNKYNIPLWVGSEYFDEVKELHNKRNI